MSRAAQQRVIEGLQAKTRELRQELAQARADRRDALDVYERLTETCDEHELAGLKAVPVAHLRQIRPRGSGV